MLRRRLPGFDLLMAAVSQNGNVDMCLQHRRSSKSHANGSCFQTYELRATHASSGRLLEVRNIFGCSFLNYYDYYCMQLLCGGVGVVVVVVAVVVVWVVVATWVM